MLARIFFLLPCLLLSFVTGKAQKQPTTNISVVDVAPGWAGNSVNTVVFRKNSLASFKGMQFIAFYDNDGFMVLGKRQLGQHKWEIKKTQFKGNIYDAHNSISIAVDGAGFLHVAWDHHNNVLHYAKSLESLSLDLGEKTAMLGKEEKKVSYPEFYHQPDGGLMFLYRDGGSGNGNLVINSYSTGSRQWTRLQNNLIDGEGKRNAYWQACTDTKGFIHISWVWRESPDVASNHDMNYAVSRDGGFTWLKSNGDTYKLPINISTADKIAAIPQNNELINQTSMCVDANGNPVIASYWNGRNAIPQYQLAYKTGKTWKIKDAGFRTTDFSLSGAGTKKIPVSRPQVLTWGRGKKTTVAILFRDEERGNRVSLAINKIFAGDSWTLTDLNAESVGQWEPTYDTELWKKEKRLHLFIQKVEQADKEGVSQVPPQMVQVMQVGGLTK